MDNPSAQRAPLMFDECADRFIVDPKGIHVLNRPIAGGGIMILLVYGELPSLFGIFWVRNISIYGLCGQMLLFLLF